MFLDKFLEFDPAATAITVTAFSTNIIDQIAPRELGVAPRLAVIVNVGTAFTAAGAATLQVQLLASVDNITYWVADQTDAIPKANLGAGAQIALPVGLNPPQAAGIPRYYKLNYVVATGPMTAGTVQAELILDRQTPANIAYAPGITVAN